TGPAVEKTPLTSITSGPALSSDDRPARSPTIFLAFGPPDDPAAIPRPRGRQRPSLAAKEGSHWTVQPPSHDIAVGRPFAPWRAASQCLFRRVGWVSRRHSV